MIKYLKAAEFPKYLTCPFCSPELTPKLKVVANSLICPNCKRKFPIKNKIIKFVQGKLDKETARELKGNSYALTKKLVEYYANKDKWSTYYNHFVDQKFDYFLTYLNSIRMRGVMSLGSGPGFELKEILKRKKINTIFSSDLAYSATAVVPMTLKDYDLDLVLFTSDLNHTPVLKNDNFPIIIYEALHHTGDSHLTIEMLMQRRFKNILFVEPSTNFLIKFLAKFGLAQRIEYSGLKPDFIDIQRVKKLANNYKYSIKVHTLWEIPEDYFRTIFKKGSMFEPFMLLIIDAISKIGDLFQFGSFAIVSLERKGR